MRTARTQPEAPMHRFRVFFSNRSADADRVNDLKKNLRELLPNLPFDDVSEDVPFEDDWKTPALSVLGRCDAVVCVVGPDTHKSEPVDWEIRQAHELRKPIVVTRVSDDYRLPPCCESLSIAPLEWDTTELAGRIGELLVGRALFLNHDWALGPPDHAVIWNQYNLMVQSWESLIARRQTVNTLYVSAAAALLTGIGVLVSSADRLGFMSAALGAAVLSLLGSALSFNWRRTVASYGTLSRAKAKVVAALEAYMPAQLFDAEWRVLEARRYRSTTESDKQTALFFVLLFGALTLAAVGFASGQVLLAWRP
jgi:hypothetical protein